MLALAACGGDGSRTPPADASSGPPCTGALYDPCVTDDQCASGSCHLYSGTGLQVCTQVCSAAVPCPNDASGGAGVCNMMGSCKPVAANDCRR